MKKQILMSLLCLPLLATAERTYRTLSEGWTFYKGEQERAEQVSFDDSGWDAVMVPHTWSTDVIQNQKNADHYEGDGWYRLKLNIPKSVEGKRLFLRFEGALAATDVYLNGQSIGRHEGGYTAFCFEITEQANIGKANTLAVKVNNANNPAIIPDGSRLFTRFGGIYRPVTLMATEPGCITPLDYASFGVYIRQEKVSEKRADLTVTTKLSNGWKKNETFAVKTSIVDVDGTVAAQQTSTIRIDAGAMEPLVQSLLLNAPHLWNGREDPYLYSVKVEVRCNGKKVDEMIQPLGIRYFSVDANQGVVLNGKPYRMYGVCRHQDWEHEGSALSDKHHRHDVSEMVEMGATTVRLAHYPQSKTMYNLCDTNGLIVWAEIPVVQGVNLKKRGTFDNAKQQLIEMIRQNYNHPSIFFWGLYNECWLAPEKVKEMHGMAKAEDPGRLTTAASHQKLLDKHFETDLICWNKYPKWYGNFDLEAWSDELHATHPELKIGISEYGAGGCIDQHENPPPRPNPTKGRFYPEEYMNLVHEQVWPMLDERSFIWGAYLWNMFDFSWPGVTRGSRINLNNKGLISYDRQTRKDPFYYYKANWTDAPVLYITSRRFTERVKNKTPVKIYSNCDHLELEVNGKTYPTPKSDGYGVYVWPEIPLVAGDNTVKVTAQKGGRSFEDECVWTFRARSSVVVEKEEVPVNNSVYVSSVTASSEQRSKGNKAVNVTDDNPDTFWCAAQGTLPQWVALDLLQSSDIGGVEINWGQKGAYSYKIQISDDGKTWETVVEETGSSQLCSHKFKATTYFVRVLCTGTPKGSWACIRDIQVLTQ